MVIFFAFIVDLVLAGRLPSRVQPILTVLGIFIAYVCSALAMDEWSSVLLKMVIFFCGPPVVRRVVSTTLQGSLSADLVALAALFGSLILSEYFAAAMIVLMLGGGAALEEAAQVQAGIDLDELRRRVPSVAHRLRKGRTAAAASAADVEEVRVEELRIGDVLLVRAGETLPADGVLERGHALVDYASLTGEPLPVEKTAGASLLSGGVNLRAPLWLRVAERPALSSFARLTDELEAALQRPGRLQRRADLLGGFFTPVALAVATAALVYNRAARPWHAALAVLNAATPCPLLIAVPVATLAGLGVGARRALLLRGGAALEAAAAIDTLVLDKTGTLTIGRPSLRAVQLLPSCRLSAAALLQHAAAVEFGSTHLLARAICAAAAENGSPPLQADALADLDGQGVSADVFSPPTSSSPSLASPRSVSPRRASSRTRGGSARVRVAVGSARCMTALGVAAPAGGWPTSEADSLSVFVALNNVLAARLVFHDTLRPEAPDVVRRLRALGVRRVVLLSGDTPPAVEAAAAAVGADEWHALCLPQDKAAHVLRFSRAGAQVQFVGDGVNDALALARARLGVALSAEADATTDGQGTSANLAAAAAGVVVLRGSLERLVTLRVLAREVRRISLQSALGGVGASLAVMCAALLGHVPPAAGAVAQELVDLLAIGNALRVLRLSVQ